MSRWTVLVLLLFVSVSLLAEDFWVKKQYTDWSKQDCEKMLKNSPWAQQSSIAQVGALLASQETNATADVGRVGNTQITYTAQIVSALPVREAMVRQQWLANNISSMPADKQQLAKQRAEAFLNAPAGDVVVHVIYTVNNDQMDRSLANYWQHSTLETVKNTIYLIGGNGTRIEATGFEVAPGAAREFEVTFPRTVGGQPVLTPESKQLALELRAPGLGISGQPGGRRRGSGSGTAGDDSGFTRFYVPFKPKDMVVNGQLLY